MTVAATKTPRPEPLPLFDPAAGEYPPYECVELYLEAPTSVGIFHMASVLEGHDAQVAAINAAREAGVAAALECLYDHALLKIGYHARQRSSPVTVGLYGPGQLYLTRVAHLLADDRGDIARLHDHIYLGEYGIADEDGQRWPVDLTTVRLHGMTMMHLRYCRALREALTSSLGVQWAPRSATNPDFEVEDPPLAQYVPDYPRVICRDGARVAQRWNARDIAHPPKFDPDAS